MRKYQTAFVILFLHIFPVLWYNTPIICAGKGGNHKWQIYRVLN